MKLALVVLLAACSKGNDCESARRAEKQLVEAYLKTAVAKLNAQPPSDELATLDKRVDLEAKSLRLPCNAIDGLSTSPQPDTAYMTHLRDQALEVERIATEMIDQADEYKLDVKEVIPQRDALHGLLAKWSFPKKLHEGAPWPKAQRVFVAGVEKAWCTIHDKLVPQLDAAGKRMKDEFETTRREHAAQLEETTKLQANIAAARDGKVTDDLRNDPGYKPALVAGERVAKSCR